MRAQEVDGGAAAGDDEDVDAPDGGYHNDGRGAGDHGADEQHATDADDGMTVPGSSRPSRPSRRWLDVAIGVVLLVLVAVGALRWYDSTAYVVVVLQTAGPLVVVGLGLLAVVTLLLRRWWVLVPVVVALVVGAAIAAPAFRATTAPKADIDLTVMSANVSLGDANSGQLMDAVRYHAVDVLVVIEATPAFLRRLDADGAGDYFTKRQGVARAGTNTGTMVLTRFPLSVRSRGTDPGVEGTQSVQPELDVTTPKGAVRLKVAHPTAPLPGDTEQWRAGLRALQTWKQRLGSRGPVVMAGDFNAGFGHPGFRAVAEGLDDAQRADGQGWVRTWPFSGRALPAYVQLDHVLSRGLTVVAAGQVAYNRADHAAVWASYALPVR